MPGKEIVQVYVSNCTGKIVCPDRELRDFAKIFLQPGEEQEVCFRLERRAFAFYDREKGDWQVPEGEYAILVGTSSREIYLKNIVKIRSVQKEKRKILATTTCGDVMSSGRNWEPLRKLLQKTSFRSAMEKKAESRGIEADEEQMYQAFLWNMPIHSLLSFGKGTITQEELDETIQRLEEC